MHLDQGVHFQRVCGGDEFARQSVRHAGHDHEDTIRTPRTRLENLIDVKQKIFPKRGEGGCRTRLLQKIRVSLK